MLQISKPHFFSRAYFLSFSILAHYLDFCQHYIAAVRNVPIVLAYPITFQHHTKVELPLNRILYHKRLFLLMAFFVVVVVDYLRFYFLHVK